MYRPWACLSSMGTGGWKAGKNCGAAVEERKEKETRHMKTIIFFTTVFFSSFKRSHVNSFPPHLISIAAVMKGSG